MGRRPRRVSVVRAALGPSAAAPAVQAALGIFVLIPVTKIWLEIRPFLGSVDMFLPC